MPKFSVKKVRSFKGRDCPGYNCDLYMDGKKIAEVINDGSGGETEFDFTSKEVEQTFNEFIRNHPPYEVDDDLKNLYPSGMAPMSDGLFIGVLLDEYETGKKIGRLLKHVTVYRLPNDKLGTFRQVNLLGEKAKTFLTQKYGEVIIINDLYPGGEWFSALFGERTHGNRGEARL